MTLQIIPNKGIQNNDTEVLLRAIWDLYRPPLKRISKAGDAMVYVQEGATWEVAYKQKEITFQLSIPRRWESHFREKLSATWPQATIKECDRPSLDSTEVITMKLKNHFFMSLNASKRDSSLLNALVPIVRDLKNDDEAILQLAILPVNDGWRTEAIQARSEFARGRVRHRMELDGRTAARWTGEAIDGAFGFAKEIICDLVGAQPAPEPTCTAPVAAFRVDADSQAIILDGGLSGYSQSKHQHKGFDVTIRIGVSSPDTWRRQMIIKSIVTAMQGLNADNEILPDKPSDQTKAIRSLVAADIPAWKLNRDVWSMAELQRVILLPQATLLAEYPEIDQLNRRDVSLPDCLFSPDGYPLGDVTDHGITRTASIQTADHNILCLPHIALGIMGCGKTNGQGANTATGFLRSGYSAFAIDVADGKLIDTIRDALPTDFPDDHIIDLDYGNLAWPLPLTWSEITLKLAGGDGYTPEARKAANRLSAALVDFISRLSTYDTTDRMQRYLSAAAKSELTDPRASLLEPILLLTAESYRSKRLDHIHNPRVFDTIRGLHAMQEGARGQITGPIMDRLELLLSNESMANCVLQRQKLGSDGKPLMNFRHWLDGDVRGPYFVGIRVPKEELLDIATDRIVTFLTAKIWLATLSRYDIPESQRRPACFIMDEPHQFMSGRALWGDMVREARKWRLKLVWLAHNFRDFASLGKTMKDSGCQYSIYKSSKETYQDLMEELSPFDLEDLMATPDRFYAVNRIVVPDAGVTVPAFLAKMAPPPAAVKDRSYRRQQCSELFGQPIDVVEADIYEREKVLYEVQATKKK